MDSTMFLYILEGTETYSFVIWSRGENETDVSVIE